MTATLTRTTRASMRVTSLLSGAVLSAIVMSSIPTWPTPGAVAASADYAALQDSKPVPQKRNPFDEDTIAAYLEREWNLGQQYASQVASAVKSSSQRHGLDPLLLMAVAATESSFKHWVGNPGGGADPMKPFGIMQVAGRFHPDKFPGGAVKSTSVIENVDLGAQVLREYLNTERGNEKRALLRYNGTLHVSDKYFQKVSQFKKRLLRGLLAQSTVDATVQSG